MLVAVVVAVLVAVTEVDSGIGSVDVAFVVEDSSGTDSDDDGVDVLVAAVPCSLRTVYWSAFGGGTLSVPNGRTERGGVTVVVLVVAVDVATIYRRRLNSPSVNPARG